MKLTLSMMMVMLTVGCATGSQTAICDAVADPVDAHTVALVRDGGPQSKITGARLISMIDAGCAQ